MFRPEPVGHSSRNRWSATAGTRLFARHFRATVPEHLVGAHSTSPANTSLWGALDIDQHGETSAPAEVNWAAALAWYERLCLLDFDPLLIDSNGAGGFHLWVLFVEEVESSLAGVEST
jgi:hypothetical protein